MGVPERENIIEKKKEAFLVELHSIIAALEAQELSKKPETILFNAHEKAVDYFNAFERTLDEFTLSDIEVTNEISVRKAEDTINIVDTILLYWKTVNRYCEKYCVSPPKPSKSAYASSQRVLKEFYPDKISGYKNSFSSCGLPTIGFEGKSEHSRWREKRTIKTELLVGVPLLIVTIILSFIFPSLTGFQYFILRLFMALGITLLGSALLEGTASLNLSSGLGISLKATGWIAIFLAIYYMNPPAPPLRNR